MKLHASGEDYLETILVLQKKLGMVRSVDVARHMEVSKPSVCHAVATLRDGGFLTMDEPFFVHQLIGRGIRYSQELRHHSGIQKQRQFVVAFVDRFVHSPSMVSGRDG